MDVSDEGRLAAADGPADDGLDQVGPGAVNVTDCGRQPVPGAGPGRADPGKAVLVINGVIAAVGGTYTSTHSLPVTVLAGCAGLACGVLFAWKR